MKERLVAAKVYHASMFQANPLAGLLQGSSRHKVRMCTEDAENACMRLVFPLLPGARHDVQPQEKPFGVSNDALCGHWLKFRSTSPALLSADFKHVPNIVVNALS